MITLERVVRKSVSCGYKWKSIAPSPMFVVDLRGIFVRGGWFECSSYVYEQDVHKALQQVKIEWIFYCIRFDYSDKMVEFTHFERFGLIFLDLLVFFKGNLWKNIKCKNKSVNFKILKRKKCYVALSFHIVGTNQLLLLSSTAKSIQRFLFSIAMPWEE